jgi:hypothetical protein
MNLICIKIIVLNKIYNFVVYKFFDQKSFKVWKNIFKFLDFEI